ncbi:hypothetical protein [Arenivirga flava]|uniref:Iron ABC transporter ATP-binding protein n=1 Tax=Arenivirga flava TaxID=1930060 RepID=A0AA37UCR7_9MICO|nr:hypothetical protein [Arenivirga flava]GMA26888.1 hypothetical protein GCM10025874_01410 [Arenivirga flava]
MSRPPRIRSSRLVTIGAVAATAGLLLAGCTPASGEPEPSESAAAPSPSAEAPSSSPAPSASASEAPEPDGTPVAFGCDEVLTLDEMYAYNPNFGRQDDWTPAAGSAQAEVVAEQGISCQWVNLTSGITIEVGVSQLSDGEIVDRHEALQASSTAVPTFGAEGYFTVVDGVGEAQVFSGPYRVVATSTAFVEPGEAEQIVRSAVDGLPAA